MFGFTRKNIISSQVLALLWIALFLGCEENKVSGPKLPPMVCLSPGMLGGGPYFTDVTKEVGFGKDDMDVQGNRLAAADLDGDLMPDLVVHKVTSNKRDNMDEIPGGLLKRVLLNRVKAEGRFEDKTLDSGFLKNKEGTNGRSAQLAVFADVDNDGDLDAFSGTYTDPSKDDPGDRSAILLNDGTGKFSFAPDSDVTPGKQSLWSTSSATFLDYDLDGDIDLFVGFWYMRYGQLPGLQDRLYRGNGDGTFIDVTDKVGLTTDMFGYDKGTNHRPTYGVTACDVDNDGMQDLLVSAYGRQWNMQWMNKGAKFEDQAAKSGFAGDELRNYSDDQFYRCYCKTVGGCDPKPPNPAVQCPDPPAWNPGTDDHPFRLNGNTFTTLCEDVDNDGDMDLFNAEIRHWWAGESSDPSQILVNDGKGDFTRPGRQATGLSRVHYTQDWNEGDISAVFFDFDNDGGLDLFIAASDYPDQKGLLYHRVMNVDKLRYQDVSDISGVDQERPQEVVAFDIDSDGDDDLVMGSSTMRDSPWKTPEVHVYRNDVGQLANRTVIHLEGAGEGGANRAAIGARVEILADGMLQTRHVDGGHGHFGLQNSLAVRFGLGNSCRIDKLTVTWPDKDHTRDEFSNVLANYVLMISQEKGLEYGPCLVQKETDQ
ncbi:MAG: CRTAC1 family protein [Deltaproteobacteria bacterium]|nr:CRTAC1 family protein [Deltaproteobacteria bacterium]